jgi:hypothetical protein
MLMGLTEREVAICEAIHDAIRKAKPKETYKGLGIKTGLGKDIVGNLALGRTEPTDDRVQILRKVLRKPESWPYDAIEPRLRLGEPVVLSTSGIPLERIRVVGSVAAGGGEFNVDEQEELIYVPARMAQIGPLGWRVKGDSLMPRIEEGDILCYKAQTTPRKGFPFLLRNQQDGLRTKVMDWANGEWIVRSTSAKYPPEPLADHQIIGIMVGWYRSKGVFEATMSDSDGLRIENIPIIDQ